MTKTPQGQTLSIGKAVLGNRNQLYKLSIDYESKVNVSPVMYLWEKDAEIQDNSTVAGQLLTNSDKTNAHR